MEEVLDLISTILKRLKKKGKGGTKKNEKQTRLEFGNVEFLHNLRKS